MEKYCALCGVGFGIFTPMYNNDYNEEQDGGFARLRDVGRVTDDDVSWTYDFVARNYLLLEVRVQEAANN